MPPGVAGVDHPTAAFSDPQGVATDFDGNIYVSSFGTTSSNGRIDIFDAEGLFLTEISGLNRPSSLAVDSKGFLYVVEEDGRKVRRYTRTDYDPLAPVIEYSDPPVTIGSETIIAPRAVAVNFANDHLFVNYGDRISEYGSGSESNPLIEDDIINYSNNVGVGLAIDAAHQRIYVVKSTTIEAYNLAAPHEHLVNIDGSSGPGGKFQTAFLPIAVNEGTGNVFVFDASTSTTKVREFTGAGVYVTTIEHGFQPILSSEGRWLAVDNGPNSPNGALNPGGRYLLVPSHRTGVGHVFAFGPSRDCQPEVDSVSAEGVTDDEAELRASVNPCGLSTDYTFEYVTQQSFEDEGGFAGARVAGEGHIPAGKGGVEVSGAATGLEAGTAYRFRVVATNAKGTGEEQGTFATYLAPEAGPACANALWRTGLSAALPDCRGYELVTPADTNGRTPLGGGRLGATFASRTTSPAGDKVTFQIQGGGIPGFEVTGSYAGDPYLAVRGPGGWSTSATGPDGTEALHLLPGSVSPDQDFSFWGGQEGGSAVIGDNETDYVRYPDGRSELIGRGSLTADPLVSGKLISPGGEHVIFTTSTFNKHVPLQLEPDAPASPTTVIYDRTSDETTHVVSLLPGDATPAAGEGAEYEGASPDGKGVAFSIGKTLYLRYDNEETYEIGEDVSFAGVAEGGERVFYLDDGDLFAFDVQGETRTPFSVSGDVTPVNVSADGTSAYLVSPSVLSSEANPNGDLPKTGQKNLYLSREGSLSFVGTLTDLDVEGRSIGGVQVEGLGLWLDAVTDPGRLVVDPSRATPNGSTLLFESRATLTGQETDGTAQVYRYDSTAEELDCLSCNPTGARPTGGARLQSIGVALNSPEPLGLLSIVNNLSLDGRRAFFESSEPLVLDDHDGLQDVYQWEAQGVGSCTRAEGCVSLISSGRSARDDYLYAVSDSGNDVFIRTADLLLPALDPDETPSIYDARVGGGFPPPLAPAGECLGEACQPAGVPAADPPASIRGAGNVGPEGRRRACPKGKRKVRRAGKSRCVPRKAGRERKHHKRRSGR